MNLLYFQIGIINDASFFQSVKDNFNFKVSGNISCPLWFCDFVTSELLLMCIVPLLMSPMVSRILGRFIVELKKEAHQ